MIQYKHFHLSIRVLAIILILVASVFLIQKSEKGTAYVGRPNSIEIGGWAWSEEVGWISLNCKNDFDGDGEMEDTCGYIAYPYKLEVNSYGNVVGCAYGGTSKNGNSSTTLGYICFSDPDGTTLANDYGLHIVTETGFCEGPTSCTLDSQCNASGENLWECTDNNYCQIECSSDADCRSGQTCNIMMGKNYICDLGYFTGAPGCPINNFSDASISASIVDFEDLGYDAWRLNFNRNVVGALTTSSGAFTSGYNSPGFDHDHPNWNVDENVNGANGEHPIEGCFNCSERNIGQCFIRSIDCVEGGTECQDPGPLDDTCQTSGSDAGYCNHSDAACDTDEDCGEFEDYCEINDIEYFCENCLDYHYYDQENTEGRGDQCSISAKSCVYDDTPFPNGYKFRREITIDDIRVSGDDDLTNFPFLIDETQDYLAWTGNGGDIESRFGYDIVFASDEDGNTPLDHDVEYYDYRTGKLASWVRIPTLATSTDTSVYMFYGSSTVNSETSQRSSVWVDYHFVSHMDDYSYGHVRNVASTSESLGDKYLEDSPSQKISTASFGQSFDGVDDYIDFGDIVNADMPFTISAIYSPDGTGSDDVPRVIISTDESASEYMGAYMYLAAYGAGNEASLSAGFGDGIAQKYKYTDDTISGSNRHFAASFAGTDYSDIKLYIDGSEEASSNGGTSTSTYTYNTNTLRIGMKNGQYGVGLIDEVRIAKLIRSEDWLKTVKNNYDSSFYSIGCRQVYNDDSECECDNPEYFNWLGCTDECDVCEERELNSLYKVLAGYYCSDCTIEDYSNSCSLNAFDQNLNRCRYCRYVYPSPGLMYDNQNNTILSTSTSGCDPAELDPGELDFCDRGQLCGWGLNSWAATSTSYGLGWFQFSPRITTTSKPYFSVEGGNIYSKGSIFSRYSPPLGKYNATYLIEAGGEIINIISSSTISGSYEGELAYRPTIDFFEILSVGSSVKYKSSLGLIDYTGIVTDVGSGAIQAGTNKYGSAISLPNPATDQLFNNRFEGGVKYLNGDYTVEATDDGIFDMGINDSTGVVVVNGDLTINRDLSYDSTGITNYKKIPSLVWIVLGDVNVDGNVEELVGTFIILGDNGGTCIVNPEDPGCGQFNSGASDRQLEVDGSVLAHSFSLQRTYYDGSGEPSEKFINTGRLQSNPPKGMEDLNKLSPRYDY